MPLRCLVNETEFRNCWALWRMKCYLVVSYPTWKKGGIGRNLILWIHIISPEILKTSWLNSLTTNEKYVEILWLNSLLVLLRFLLYEYIHQECCYIIKKCQDSASSFQQLLYRVVLPTVQRHRHFHNLFLYMYSQVRLGRLFMKNTNYCA